MSTIRWRGKYGANMAGSAIFDHAKTWRKWRFPSMSKSSRERWKCMKSSFYCMKSHEGTWIAILDHRRHEKTQKQCIYAISLWKHRKVHMVATIFTIRSPLVHWKVTIIAWKHSLHTYDMHLKSRKQKSLCQGNQSWVVGSTRLPCCNVSLFFTMGRTGMEQRGSNCAQCINHTARDINCHNSTTWFHKQTKNGT